MKKNRVALWEAVLVLILTAGVLASQLLGTASISDSSQTVDENGLPVTTTTLKDLERPGTKFGSLTMPEWEDAITKRYPLGEIRHYNSMANMFAGLEAGEIDAALGFIDERQTLAVTYPDLAFIT